MAKGESTLISWASHALPPPPLMDQTGRVLGKRAQGTRKRLLVATKRLLDRESLRELRVSDIAREVESSPATFYQYFKDVEEAVLALAEQASRELPAVAELLAGSWAGEAGLERARRLVEAFIEHWDEHHSVLRVRNLASDEGDERFRKVRANAMSPVLSGLARLVEEAQAAGRIPGAEDPLAAASAMGAILERMATYHRELASGGVSRDQLVETSARILHRSVTGERLP